MDDCGEDVYTLSQHLTHDWLVTDYRVMWTTLCAVIIALSIGTAFWNLAGLCPWNSAGRLSPKRSAYCRIEYSPDTGDCNHQTLVETRDQCPTNALVACPLRLMSQ